MDQSREARSPGAGAMSQETSPRVSAASLSESISGTEHSEVTFKTQVDLDVAKSTVSYGMGNVISKDMQTGVDKR